MRIKHIVITIILIFGWQGMAQDPFQNFPVAWTFYQNGSFKDAKAIVEKGLVSPKTTPHLRANYLYLKGLLLVRDEHGDTLAAETFKEAITLYIEVGSGDGVNSARLGLVTAYLNLEKLDLASQTLMDVQSDPYLEPKQKGYALSLKSHLFFLQGDYEKALAISQDSFRIYTLYNDKRGIADALVNIGRYKMLTGAMDEGYETTLHAQEKIIGISDANKFYFALANIVLYQRCHQGLDGEGPIKLIKARLEMEPDKCLQQVLAKALEEPCPN